VITFLGCSKLIIYFFTTIYIAIKTKFEYEPQLTYCNASAINEGHFFLFLNSTAMEHDLQMSWI